MADSKGSLKSFFRKILRLRPRDQIEKAWTEDDPTFGYRPSRLLPSELVIDELPLFTLRTARMMLSDPVVRIGLTCRNAALAPAQIEVTCKDARVREWIGNQWQYLWNKHRTSLLRAKIFGHVGLQLELEKNKKTGTIDIAGVKEFAPEDIRPLSHGGKVAALRVKSRLSVPVLLPPRGVYLSFDDDAGNPGGASILKRAYSPWWEKHMPTGALATRRLRLIKDAYIGDVFQFPFAEVVNDEFGNPIPWRDIIRSVSEARLSGATIVLPRKMDAEGNEQITYTPPQDTGSPTGIYEWVDKLDRDIWRGLDVFEEVIQAAETGSGFSGRSIPLVMFLEGCEEELVQIIKGLDQYVFGPLVYWNFGPNVEYDIKVVPLVKTFATEMGGSPMGGESMGGQASSRPPGGQQPPPPQQGQPAKPKPGPPGGAPQRKPTQFREPAETGGIPTIDYAQSDAIASRTVSALRDVMRLRPSEIRREVGKQRRGQQRLRRGDNTLSAMLSVIPILITRKQQRAQEIAEDGLFASAVVGAAAAQATLEREAEAVQAAIVASPTAPTEPVAPAVMPVDEIPVPEFRTVPDVGENLDISPVVPQPAIQPDRTDPPRGRIPSTEATFGRRKRVRFPNEIRARKKLRDSIALAGQDYRETARMVREDAFAITTKMGDDIVSHIRDALKKNMREGMDLKSFIAEVEKIQRGQEYPLSRARIELVFRANTARYLSDAADAALNNPMVADQFPYRAYAATHDDRVRDTHLRLEQTGLNGTNVYRGDDPAWKAFRPPWAYSCRCAWRPVGVRQAARIGVVEANNWLARATARANAEGGIADQYLVRVKPASGEHVAWPSIDGETFYPSPEWTRNGIQFGEPWGRITVDKPTEAQKKAGNYRKGHVTWNGLRIAIENPRGSIRSGDGWRVVMKSHYGYIKSTEGRDGDHVDVFLGPNPDSEIVFIVNQVDRNGKFDEHKCLIGWDNEDDAKAGYLANYSKGWKCGPIVSMTLPQFKEWLENGNTRKPCCEQFAEVQRGLFGDDFDVESKPVSIHEKILNFESAAKRRIYELGLSPEILQLKTSLIHSAIQKSQSVFSFVDEQIEQWKAEFLNVQFKESARGWRKLGGASVYIVDGVVEKGCPGLKGEEVSNLINESDESRDRREKRQDVAESRGLDGEDVTKAEVKQLEKTAGVADNEGGSETKGRENDATENQKATVTIDDRRQPEPGRPDSGNAGSDAQPKPATSQRVILQRSEFTSKPDIGRVPESLRPHLTETQQEGVAAALTSLDKNGGFLLADGTGVGKTRQLLAVAKSYADEGRKVVIVAPSEVIKPDWKKGTVGGSYSQDASAMGIQFTLQKGDAPLGGRSIAITTYNELDKLKSHIDSDTVVLFDESHAMKNSMSARGKAGREVSFQAGKVLYATATPADKPLHIAHLLRAGVFGGGSETAKKFFGKSEETYRTLGLIKQDVRTPGGTIQKWVINPRVGVKEVARRIEGLFDQMTSEGLMIQRSMSLDNVNVHTSQVNLSPEAADEVQRVYERSIDEHPSNKAIAIMAMRRAQEPHKIPATVDTIKTEIAAGRSLIVFLGRVNDNIDDDSDEDIVDENTVKLLKLALQEAGISDADVGELHGAAANTADAKRKAMESFNGGKTKILLATLQSGGTGVNLDDTTGERPRTVIMMTPPLSANDSIQAIGRINRLSTRSDAKVINLVSDHEIDQWNISLLNKKMAVLGATTKGTVASTGDDEDSSRFEWPKKLTSGEKKSQAQAKTNDSAVDATKNETQQRNESVPTRQVSTRFGPRHVHSFSPSKAFWDARTAGKIPKSVSVSKNPKTNQWEATIWGESPKHTNSVYEQLQQMRVV